MRPLALTPTRARAPFSTRMRSLALLAILGLSLGPVSAHAADDPYALDSSGNLGVNPSQSVGQSFTVRIPGRLQGIEIAPQRDSASPTDLVFLELFNGLGESLGSASLMAGAFPPGNGVPAFLQFGVAGPGYFDLSGLDIHLTENQTFTFVITKPSTGTARAGINPNAYSGGTAFVNGSPSPSLDLSFKVVFLPTPRLLVGAANGQFVRVFSTSTGASIGNFTANGPTTSGPASLVIGGPNRRLYVKTWSGPRIDEYDGFRGTFVRILVPTGVQSGGGRITLGPDGRLYGPNATGAGGISRWNITTGALVSEFVPAGRGGLGGVGGLAFGPDGNLYVGSMNYTTNEHKVLRFAGVNGAYLGEFVTNGSGGLKGPDDLTFGPDGSLFVTSRDTHNVLRFDGTTGAFLGVFAADGTTNFPFGLAFGPDGFLYVSYCGPDHVVRFNGSTGEYIGIFISGTNACPTDVIFTDGTIHQQLDVAPRAGPAPALELLPITPNPASRDMAIRFRLSRAGEVRMTVRDVSGRVVRALIDRTHFDTGSHRVEWDARDGGGNRVRPGMYFVDLVVGDSRSKRSVALLDAR